MRDLYTPIIALNQLYHAVIRRYRPTRFYKHKYAYRSIKTIIRTNAGMALSCLLLQTARSSAAEMQRYASFWWRRSEYCKACKRGISSQRLLANHYRVIEDMVSEEEEQKLTIFLDLKFGRKRYQGAHWDSVISGFKETELYDNDLFDAPDECTQIGQIVKRVTTFVQQSYAIREGASPMMLPHAIDLSEEGYIDPHVDSIKRSGGILAGLSLHSARIMRLKYDTEQAIPNQLVSHLQLPFLRENEVLDIPLPQRSLYLLEGPLRYTHTHSILGNGNENGIENAIEQKKQKKQHRERRLSIIFRDEPYNEGESIEEAIQIGISQGGLLFK